MFKNREKFSEELEFQLFKEKLQFRRGIFIGILAFIAFFGTIFLGIYADFSKKKNECMQILIPTTYLKEGGVGK